MMNRFVDWIGQNARLNARPIHSPTLESLNYQALFIHIVFFHSYYQYEAFVKRIFNHFPISMYYYSLAVVFVLRIIRACIASFSNVSSLCEGF